MYVQSCCVATHGSTVRLYSTCSPVIQTQTTVPSVWLVTCTLCNNKSTLKEMWQYVRAKFRNITNLIEFLLWFRFIFSNIYKLTLMYWHIPFNTNTTMMMSLNKNVYGRAPARLDSSFPSRLKEWDTVSHYNVAPSVGCWLEPVQSAVQGYSPLTLL